MLLRWNFVHFLNICLGLVKEWIWRGNADFHNPCLEGSKVNQILIVSFQYYPSKVHFLEIEIKAQILSHSNNMTVLIFIMRPSQFLVII